MLATRRAPFPGGLLVDGTLCPLMIDDKTGEYDFRADKVKPFSDVTPVDQKYQNLPVYRERTYEWTQLAGGFGHTMQVQEPADKDGFYSWCEGVDASVQGQVILGPAITSVTPPTTGAAVRLLELGGVVYLLASEYVLKHTGDMAAQWTVSKDLGGGKACTGGIVLAQDVAGSTPYLVVGMGNTAGSDFIWRFDGTTWTQHVSLKARNFAMLDFIMYQSSGGNFLRTVDIRTDWWQAANYSADNLFTIGDNAYPITELCTTPTDTLFVVKQDNIFTIDKAGFTNNLYGSMRSSPDDSNGRGWAWWGTNVYVPTPNAGLIELEPIRGIGGIIGTKYNQMGPELLGENNTPVKGIVTAVEGTKFALYALLWDPDNNITWLIKYGGRTEAGELIKVWNGSIAARFSGKKGLAMLRSADSAPSGHERLYMAFDDGSVSWFVLSCQANPVACSQYRYQLTGTMNLPITALGYAANVKSQNGWSVFARSLAAGQYAQVASRPDIGASYTDTGSRFTQTAGQRNNFATPLSGRLCDAQVTLTTTDNTKTPQVAAVAVEHNLVPDYLQEFAGTVDGRPHAILRDGRSMRQTPEAVKAAMKTAASSVSSAWTTPHDEQARTVVVYDHAEIPQMADQHRRGGLLIPFKAVEYASLATYGIWDRWDVRNWNFMDQLTWDERQAL